MIKQPTVFHVTNHKAGSQWVAEILKHCVPDRFTKPATQVSHMLEKATKVGAIVPTVYLPRPQFEGSLLGKFVRPEYFFPNPYKHLWTKTVNWYHFGLFRYPHKIFVVIRDLRDILVSHYFSLLVSHSVSSDRIANYRENLGLMDKDEGMLYLLKEIIPLQAQIQMSWLSACQSGQALLVKFEDLLSDEHFVFEKIVDYCQIEVNRQRLHDIVKYNSFELVAGRKRGQEDVSAHLRKGITGDWRNHFTEVAKVEFKKRYGQLLIDTDYEKDLNW